MGQCDLTPDWSSLCRCVGFWTQNPIWSRVPEQCYCLGFQSGNGTLDHFCGTFLDILHLSGAWAAWAVELGQGDQICVRFLPAANESEGVRSGYFSESVKGWLLRKRPLAWFWRRRHLFSSGALQVMGGKWRMDQQRSFFSDQKLCVGENNFWIFFMKMKKGWSHFWQHFFFITFA